MPTRIEIELTSAGADGSWTWRAAGAREPRGTLDGSILPAGATVGDQLKVESEKDIDGIHIVWIVQPKQKTDREGLLELLPSGDFEPVIQQRATRDRHEGGPWPSATANAANAAIVTAAIVAAHVATAKVAGRPTDATVAARGATARGAASAATRVRISRRRRSCRSGRSRSVSVRASCAAARCLPASPRSSALSPSSRCRVMAAVRQRLREDNARLKAEDKPEMPEATVLKMAENLLPQLRVADWLDRAEAAKRQLAHLDLRDLRSVVASSDDPLVVRDETTRDLAAELKVALVAKQDEELNLWLADVEAAVEVGRVVRALALVGDAAEGRRAVPASAGRPSRRGHDGVVVARGLRPTAGSPCSRRRRSRRCARS